MLVWHVDPGARQSLVGAALARRVLELQHGHSCSAPVLVVSLWHRHAVQAKLPLHTPAPPCLLLF